MIAPRVQRVPGGYTRRICLGCFRDALVPCRHARTPLCDDCLDAHVPWQDVRGGGARRRLNLPPAPQPPRELRPAFTYVHPVPPLGRAKRRLRR